MQVQHADFNVCISDHFLFVAAQAQEPLRRTFQNWQDKDGGTMFLFSTVPENSQTFDLAWFFLSCLE